MAIDLTIRETMVSDMTIYHSMVNYEYRSRDRGLSVAWSRRVERLARD